MAIFETFFALLICLANISACIFGIRNKTKVKAWLLLLVANGVVTGWNLYVLAVWLKAIELQILKSIHPLFVTLQLIGMVLGFVGLLLMAQKSK